MAISFVGAGTAAGLIAGITLTVPAGYAAGDLGIILVETANQDLTTPSGWTLVTNSPQGTGTAGAAGGTRLYVFYKILTASESSVATADSGDHQSGQYFAYRGTHATTPIGATAGSVLTSGNTSITLPSITTTARSTQESVAVDSDRDGSGTTVFSSWTNANLTGITERGDYGSAAGSGGAVGLADGVKATAGTTGTSTVTQSSSVTAAMLTIELIASATSVDATTTPTGVSTTSEIGTATTTTSANATPTGVSTTSEIGTASASGGVNSTATPDGVSTTTGSGTATVTASSTKDVTGSEVTTATGIVTITPISVVIVTGNEVIVAIGTSTTTASSTNVITGSNTIISLGTSICVANSTKEITTGSEAITAIGSVITKVDQLVIVTGNNTSTGIGEIIAESGVTFLATSHTVGAYLGNSSISGGVTISITPIKNAKTAVGGIDFGIINAYWPLPDIAMQEVKSGLLLISDMNNPGIIQSRRVSSRNRIAFKIDFTNISAEEYHAIEYSYKYNIGKPVIFKHPITNEESLVVFTNDTLEKTYTTSQSFATSLTLETI